MSGASGGIFRWTIALCAALTCLCFDTAFRPARAAIITSTWNFGSGGGDGTTWTQAGNWTNSDGSSRFPRNFSPDTFHVVVPSSGATIVVPQNLGVSSLTFSGTLGLLGGGNSPVQLTVLSSVTNDGTLKMSISSCSGCHTRLMPDGSLLVLDGGACSEAPGGSASGLSS
jgi:hypothetical protein